MSESDNPEAQKPEDPTPVRMIPVSTFEQLYAMRYDLNTDGRVDDDENASAYKAAFPDVVYEAGNPTKYVGYKLTKNLDFNQDASYSDAATNKNNWTSGTGWQPIGFYNSSSDHAVFMGIFDGEGHTISHLYMKTSINRAKVGLFGALNGVIRNVGIVNPNVTGTGEARGPFIAGLVGYQTGGTIHSCYVSGGTIIGGIIVRAGGLVGAQTGGTIHSCYVSGIAISGHLVASLGGLVGSQFDGTIHSCYVSGGRIVNRENANNGVMGGLVGYSSGIISVCYVSGTAMEGSNPYDIGGLVGRQASGTIRACYVSKITATGGNNRGSLIGNQQGGDLIASYARGEDYTISLRGTESGTVTNSYSQKATVSNDDNTDKTVHDKTQAALQAPTNTTAYDAGSIYENWDLNLDSDTNTQDPWDFGTSSQYPVLKIDFDNDGDKADDVIWQRS